MFYIIFIIDYAQNKNSQDQKAPAGFSQIEPVLKQFEKQMKDAENAPMDAQTKIQNLWRITRLHHQRSKYIYELFYGKKQISRELYEFLLHQKFADPTLIAKWKKTGYEKLCCLQCINSKDNNYKNACICRVPKSQLQQGKLVMCKCCGCRGCASCD